MAMDGKEANGEVGWRRRRWWGEGPIVDVEEVEGGGSTVHEENGEEGFGSSKEEGGGPATYNEEVEKGRRSVAKGEEFKVQRSRKVWGWAGKRPRER